MQSERCFICETDKAERFQYCEECEHLCCLDCIALTACQTSYGVCVNCFDYKCTFCKSADLPRSRQYLEDAHPLPECPACHKDQRSWAKDDDPEMTNDPDLEC